MPHLVPQPQISTAGDRARDAENLLTTANTLAAQGEMRVSTSYSSVTIKLIDNCATLRAFILTYLCLRSYPLYDKCRCRYHHKWRGCYQYCRL